MTRPPSCRSCVYPAWEPLVGLLCQAAAVPQASVGSISPGPRALCFLSLEEAQLEVGDRLHLVTVFFGQGCWWPIERFSLMTSVQEELLWVSLIGTRWADIKGQRLPKSHLGYGEAQLDSKIASCPGGAGWVAVMLPFQCFPGF